MVFWIVCLAPANAWQVSLIGFDVAQAVQQIRNLWGSFSMLSSMADAEHSTHKPTSW
jgi:hypothetical protein